MRQYKFVSIFMILALISGIAIVTAIPISTTSNDYKANIYSLDDMAGGTYNSIIVEVTDTANIPVEGVSVNIKAGRGYYSGTYKTDNNGLIVVRFTVPQCAGSCSMPVYVSATKTVKRVIHTADATKTINLHLRV